MKTLFEYSRNIMIGEYGFLRAVLTYFSEILEKIFFNEYYLNIRIMFT